MASDDPIIGTFTLSQYVNCVFEPLPDITAYELAKLLPYFMPGRPITEEDWSSFGTMTRHLKRYE